MTDAAPAQGVQEDVGRQQDTEEVDIPANERERSNYLDEVDSEVNTLLDSLEQQFASLQADFENAGGEEEEEEELNRRRSELRVIKEKAEKISSIIKVASKIPDPEVEGIMLTSDSSKRRSSDSSRIISLSTSIAKLLVQAEMQELDRAAGKEVVEAAMVNTADKQQQQQQAEVQEVEDAADKEEAVQEEGDVEGGVQEEEASRIEAAVRTKHMHPLAKSHSLARKKRPLAYHTHAHESSMVTTGSINESTKGGRRRRRRRRMTRRRRSDMLFYAGKDPANSEGNDIEGAHAVEKGAGRASGSAKAERDCGERRGGGVKEEAGEQAGRG